MKFNQIALAIAICAFGVGCSSIEHSRDLANPSVSSITLAQQVCSLCHGIDGNSVSPNFPRLAGQSPEYLVSQLMKFKAHQRLDPPGFEYMWGLSRSLTDEQIKGLAEYFSKQAPVANEAVDPQQMASGKAIFENGVPAKEAAPCIACHGPNAQGLATFPRLAGQHQDYLVKQLHVFQSTEGRPDTPMKQITHFLSEEEMDAVAGYLQAFPSSQ
jgi:cytochrome c553